MPFSFSAWGEVVQWTGTSADTSYSCILGIYKKCFLNSCLKIVPLQISAASLGTDGWQANSRFWCCLDGKVIETTKAVPNCQVM